MLQRVIAGAYRQPALQPGFFLCAPGAFFTRWGVVAAGAVTLKQALSGLQGIRNFGWLSRSCFVHDLYFHIPLYNRETKINVFDLVKRALNLIRIHGLVGISTRLHLLNALFW